MAITADSVVVELEARVDQYNARIADSATRTDAAMGKIGASAVRAEQQFGKSAGRIANAQRNLGRQFADVGASLSSGSSPFVILAQQSGQVADALADTGGKAARIAAFFAGPWGSALLAAGLVAGVFAEKLFKGGEAAEDLTQKLEDNAAKALASEEANAIFSRTLEGVEDNARELRKALDELNNSHKTSAERVLQDINATIARAKAYRQEAVAALELAQALFEAQRARASGPGQGNELAALGLSDRIEAVERQRARLSRTDDVIARIEGYRREAQALVVVERASRSAADIANDRADAEIRNRRKAAAQGKLTLQQLDAEVKAINRARDAELERISERDKAERKSATRSAQRGRRINESEARSIVEGIGGTVTSGTRSRATQERLYARYRAGQGPLAAKPGTSNHETGNALDVRKSPGITLAKLRKAFEDRGVRITEALDEGSHYHIAWASTAKAQASEARKQLAEQNKQVRDDEAFGREREQLSREIIGAQRGQAQSAREFADAERDRVESQFRQRQQAIEADLKTGKYDAAQAAELGALNEYAKILNLRNIALNEDLQFLDEQAEKGRAIAATRENELQTDLALASNNKERMAIEREILRVKYEQRDAELKIALAKAQTAGDAEKVALLERQLANLPRERRADEVGLAERGRGSYDSYRDRLTDGDALSDDIDNIKIQTLEDVTDELMNATKAALGLKGAFGDIVGELIRIGIQRKLIGPLADALFGKQGGEGGGGVLGSLLGSIIGSAPGRASGGNVMAGKAYMTGENGRELFVPSQSGKIYPTGALNAAASRGGGGTVVQQTFVLDARGGVVTQDLLRDVNRISAQRAAQAGKTAYEASPARLAKQQSLGT